jgi:hypothetical protein
MRNEIEVAMSIEALAIAARAAGFAMVSTDEIAGDSTQVVQPEAAVRRSVPTQTTASRPQLPMLIASTPTLSLQRGWFGGWFGGRATA